MPESPSSPIRLTEADPLRPQSITEAVSDENILQLSPICRSPRSKGLRVQRLECGEVRTTKREEGCSGSLKRLFSPPDEPHNTKRPRIVLSPKNSNVKLKRPLIGPLKVTRLSGDLSGGHSPGTELGFNDSRNTAMSLKPVSHQSWGEPSIHQESRDRSGQGCGFTLITEHKAADAHDPTAQTVIAAPKRNRRETEATRTAVTSSTEVGNNVTSSEQAAGIFFNRTYCLVCTYLQLVNFPASD